VPISNHSSNARGQGTRPQPIPVRSATLGSSSSSLRRMGSSELSEIRDITPLIKQCNQCNQDLQLWCDGAEKHRYARVGEHNFGFCDDECWAEWLSARTSSASSLTESSPAAGGSNSNSAYAPSQATSATPTGGSFDHEHQYMLDEPNKPIRGTTPNDNDISRAQDQSPQAYLNKIISNQLKSLRAHTTSTSSSFPDSSTSRATQSVPPGTSLPSDRALKISNPAPTSSPLSSTHASTAPVSVQMRDSSTGATHKSDWQQVSTAQSETQGADTQRRFPLSPNPQWRSLENSRPRSLLAAALGSAPAVALEVPQPEDAMDLI
jgi:hypothetical protein